MPGASWDWGQQPLRSHAVSSSVSKLQTQTTGTPKAHPDMRLSGNVSHKSCHGCQLDVVGSGMSPGRACSWAGQTEDLAEAGRTHAHKHIHAHTHISCCPHHAERRWVFRATGAPGGLVGQRQQSWGSVKENTVWCPWHSHFHPCSSVSFPQSENLINNLLRGLSFA